MAANLASFASRPRANSARDRDPGLLHDLQHDRLCHRRTRAAARHAQPRAARGEPSLPGHSVPDARGAPGCRAGPAGPVRGKISRGKVECRLGYTQSVAGAAHLELNQELTRQLGTLNEQVQALLPDSEPLRIIDVLRWPGVLASNALAGRRAARRLHGPGASDGRRVQCLPRPRGRAPQVLHSGARNAHGGTGRQRRAADAPGAGGLSGKARGAAARGDRKRGRRTHSPGTRTVHDTERRG